jgi:hypothetical protein
MEGNGVACLCPEWARQWSHSRRVCPVTQSGSAWQQDRTRKTKKGDRDPKDVLVRGTPRCNRLQAAFRTARNLAPAASDRGPFISHLHRSVLVTTHRFFAGMQGFFDMYFSPADFWVLFNLCPGIIWQENTLKLSVSFTQHERTPARRLTK